MNFFEVGVPYASTSPKARFPYDPTGTVSNPIPTYLPDRLQFMVIGAL